MNHIFRKVSRRVFIVVLILIIRDSAYIDQYETNQKQNKKEKSKGQ